MKILAYDCSSSLLSVALYDDAKKIGELFSEPGARHSTVLAPMIEKLLKRSRVKLTEVDVFAVGIGPGSFTGLRVAVATAKVLAYALKKKIVGVSSLEAVAREALGGKDGRVAVALDARKSKVYGAEYERRGKKFRTLVRPGLFDAKDFPGVSGQPGAAGVAEAALERIRQKKFVDPFRLEPLYLHPRDCNVTQPRKK